jgi:GMP synthase (glutamine-hydrolysing)
MKTVHCIQHVPFEHPARIAAWAKERGVRLHAVHAYAGDPFPEPGEVDSLVVMGGPMGVHDESRYPWLVDEKRLIGAALAADKPVLGVCLGAQMVAAVLGARVYRNRFREIGWHRIEATAAGRRHERFPFPAEALVYHWHGDTFDLPAGAVHLARSSACEHQAFACGSNVLGLQFHLEMTPLEIDALITHCQDDMGNGPYVQAPRDMRAPEAHFAATHQLLARLLDGWKGEPDADETPENAA